jgi:transposase
MELLAERGIDVSKRTLLRWVQTFGPLPPPKPVSAVDDRAAYPAHAELQRWATQVHGLDTRAKRFKPAKEVERARAKERFEQRLLALCAPSATDAQAPQRRLCARIQRHLQELFVFVLEPVVPADNNAAERSLRPLVISRKISGGSRSPTGSATRMTLASIFGTWAARGEDTYASCHQLLLSPLL